MIPPMLALHLLHAVAVSTTLSTFAPQAKRAASVRQHGQPIQPSAVVPFTDPREGTAMANRAGDWSRQAVRDLEQAEDSMRATRHEWACFAAHQAAGKAVKALHLRVGEEAWGHVVATLLAALPSSVAATPDLIEKGRVLDNLYVPTRYPNGHPEGAPFEHYGPLQSSQAVNYAGEIVEFVRLQVA